MSTRRLLSVAIVAFLAPSSAHAEGAGARPGRRATATPPGAAYRLPVNPFVEAGFRFWRSALRLPAAASFPRQRVPRDQPIKIGGGRPSDPGLSLTRGKNSVTIRGVAAGDLHPRGPLGEPRDYSIARGIGFDLDVDAAPTVDVFGRTNYSEKNSRLFSVTTSAGMTDLDIADRLAKKVNDVGTYRARVTALPGGGARIDLERR
jgi:hypothetical protein